MPVVKSDVHADVTVEETKYQAGRIIQCFIYLRAGSVHDNHYAHPLDLVVFLDMNTGRVLEVLMQPNPPFIPQLNTNYLAPLVQKERGFRTGGAARLHAHS
jgi:Cu2+-containing amine oxidase